MKRRTFLKKSALALVFSSLSPWSLRLWAAPPSERITLGVIGVGRMGLGDLRAFLNLNDVQVIAVCDVDQKRLQHAKQIVDQFYAQQTTAGKYKGCAQYSDFRELLARDDLDAVAIVTPDHWHALPAIAAARAGKDIFLQKPLTYTIPEGRLLSDTVQRYGRILQVGSQQRSDAKFRFACELVRNGRIGQLHTIKVGFGQDPYGTVHPPMPVPDNLNYDFWLGPAPFKPYTEKRVHPQNDYSRPGWMRIQDYCHGMITGWGSHHVDIAHWGMGKELGGPIAVQGWAEFPKDGLWDVHGKFRLEYEYDNGVTMIVADNSQNKQGVLFLGTEGWVYVRRGFLDAHPKSLLSSTIKPSEIHLYKSEDHKINFIQCIKQRRQPVAPVEIGHRSNSACIIGAIAMRLGQPLKWDVQNEQFTNNAQANRLLTRAGRHNWNV